jgi:hypothetical protein
MVFEWGKVPLTSTGSPGPKAHNWTCKRRWRQAQRILLVEVVFCSTDISELANHGTPTVHMHGLINELAKVDEFFQHTLILDPLSL